MRQQILANLYNSKEFNDCIKKMEPVNLQEDLKNEVALVLCEMDEAKLTALHEAGQLKFYTVRIILNMIKSSTSGFYKKFRSCGFVELAQLGDMALPEYDGTKDVAMNEIDNLYWYDAEIMRLYATYGTYRAVEAETGIPHESIYSTVKKACKIIRERVNAA